MDYNNLYKLFRYIDAMKIAILGTGYVGLVTGTCLADLGHTVTCVDINEDKIKKLQKGISPIYEPGLSEVITRNVSEERLFFTTDVSCITDCKAVFIAVGTPQDEDGSADLQYVVAAAKSIATYITDYKVIITKSTVPVGTGDLVKNAISGEKPVGTFSVVSNPEFLREGAAVKDFMNPDRIVVGTDCEQAKEVMKEIYAGLERAGRPVIYTDIRSSEIIKYGANAMLATRISFINMLSQLCEKQEGNIMEVARGIGLDKRIGPRFLHAGIGYGGSCFPKDVKAITKTLTDNGCNANLLKAVDEINQDQRNLFVEKITSIMDVKDKQIAAWGLSFKPKTDDMREAPSIDIIRVLQEKGAKIVAFDPVAEENAKSMLTDVTFVKKPFEAIDKSDALVIFTEWDEFRSIDLEKVKSLMNHPLIFDGRNIYDVDQMKKKGFEYYSIGR